MHDTTQDYIQYKTYTTQEYIHGTTLKYTNDTTQKYINNIPLYIRGTRQEHIYEKRTNTYTAQHRNAFMDQQIPFFAGFIEGLASVMIALIYAF